jgi:hypothetical protein
MTRLGRIIWTVDFCVTASVAVPAKSIDNPGGTDTDLIAISEPLITLNVDRGANGHRGRVSYAARQVIIALETTKPSIASYAQRNAHRHCRIDALASFSPVECAHRSGTVS